MMTLTMAASSREIGDLATVFNPPSKDVSCYWTKDDFFVTLGPESVQIESEAGGLLVVR